MTKRRAFWEALATVGIPSLVIWTTLFWMFRIPTWGDSPYEWIPLFLILLALPLPLAIPLYKRYLSGEKRRELRSPAFHFWFAGFLIIFSIVLTVSTLREHDHTLVDFVRAGAWFIVALNQVRLGMKARALQESHDIQCKA